MSSYNIFTSHGEKLNLYLDTNKRIDELTTFIFKLVENIEYINTYDLILKHDTNLLTSDKTLKDYNIPENSNLYFIMRRKSIDIPSPNIYDSPILSNSLHNDRSQDNMINIRDDMNKLKDDIADIKLDIKDLISDIGHMRTEINDLTSDVYDIKKKNVSISENENEFLEFMD